MNIVTYLKFHQSISIIFDKNFIKERYLQNAQLFEIPETVVGQMHHPFFFFAYLYFRLSTIQKNVFSRRKISHIVLVKSPSVLVRKFHLNCSEKFLILSHFLTLITWINGIYNQQYLVGGLEHGWIMNFHILGRIIPTDEVIFFRGVGMPPTSFFQVRA